MEIFEVVLLMTVYTVLTLALFLEVVGYKRNIETLETIAFTSSLLLLVIFLTLSSINSVAEPSSEINVFILLAMCLVGCTTPLNVIKERNHTLPTRLPPLLIILSCFLGTLVLVGYRTEHIEMIQYVVAFFLGLSVIFSMILIKTTQPNVRIAHREKQEQYIAIAFLVLIPLTLFVDFASHIQPAAIRTGFTIPILFLLLGTSKLWDDIHRLSLFKDKHTLNEQDLKNYAFTNREKDVVVLLVEGYSYKQISDRLFISIPTVKTHATNIYRKCKVKNRIELMGLLAK